MTDNNWELPPDPEELSSADKSKKDQDLPTWIQDIRDEKPAVRRPIRQAQDRPPSPEDAKIIPPVHTQSEAVPQEGSAQTPDRGSRTRSEQKEGSQPPEADPNLTRRMSRPSPLSVQQPTRSSHRPAGKTRVQQQPPQHRPPIAKNRQSKIRWGRVITRTILVLLILGILGFFLAVAGSLVSYSYLASQLPSPNELRSRQFHFRTTTIYDRNGDILWEINDPNFGRRTDIPLRQISPDLRHAVIATEDRFFYSNVGVDPIAVIRAVYYNVTEGSIVSGASTITQQLARNVLLSPEERTEQSLARKVKEAVLAVELTRNYSKNEILEIYLNQIFYGNLAYGIEAASQTYFGKSANQLTLAEAALLAGLPQSPATHDPYTNPEGAKARQEVVLRLMVEDGYITPEEAEAAADEPVIENLKDLSMTMAAPHFVTYVRAELEAAYPADLIYQAGLRIETTLDRRLQAIAEEEVREQVRLLADKNANNGALIAIQPQTGQILAMVGSADFRDESIAGQINMAVSPRQPGSAIKPLVYLSAFERGWTPATLIMDVPIEYPDGAGGLYKPVNYDGKFRGPTLLRTTLANSYNIPAVKTLEFVGVDALKGMAARLGITTLTRDDYGLALALGAGETPLIEMTGAYQAIANQGVLLKPYAIARVIDAQGRDITPPRPSAKQALRPENAYLMTNILADNQARATSFGPNSVLALSRPAAAKTGTTNDFRDNLVLGYTPDMVTGVWVGNADYSPMVGTTGLSGAGPIWHNFMERAHEGLPARDFVRPANIIEVEVCADSGSLPNEVCPERRIEIFALDAPPLGPEHNINQMIDIDLNTGLRANEYCRARVETRYYRVYPPDGREWAISQGIEQPPEAYCPSTAITAKITAPADGQTARGLINIEGHAVAANFAYYQLELGVSAGPQAFEPLTDRVPFLVEGGVLGQLNTKDLPNGPYTIRLLVFDQSGGGLESRVRILVDNPPTPTPTPTSTPLPTATPTLSPTPPSTSTPSPTAPAPTATTPSPTLTPTATLTPIPAPTADIPTAAPTVAPPTPTETPTPVATSTSPPLATDTPTPAPTPTPTQPVEETPTFTPTASPPPTQTPQETPTLPAATPTPTQAAEETPTLPPVSSLFSQTLPA